MKRNKKIVTTFLIRDKVFIESVGIEKERNRMWKNVEQEKKKQSAKSERNSHSTNKHKKRI